MTVFHRCLCCGGHTLEQDDDDRSVPPGTHAICPRCGWEDVLVPHHRVSLDEARVNFATYGICDPDLWDRRGGESNGAPADWRERIAAYERERDAERPLSPCPCCGAPTIRRPAVMEYCSACAWEDAADARHDPDWISYLGLSLNEARANVQRYGISNPELWSQPRYSSWRRRDWRLRLKRYLKARPPRRRWPEPWPAWRDEVTPSAGPADELETSLCPCCKVRHTSEDICPVCLWEDAGAAAVTSDRLRNRGLSVEQGRANYRAYRISDPELWGKDLGLWVVDWGRRPTDWEVQLERYRRTAEARG